MSHLICSAASIRAPPLVRPWRSVSVGAGWRKPQSEWERLPWWWLRGWLVEGHRWHHETVSPWAFPTSCRKLMAHTVGLSPSHVGLTDVAEQDQDGALSHAAAVLQEVQILQESVNTDTRSSISAKQNMKSGHTSSLICPLLKSLFFLFLYKTSGFHPLRTFLYKGIRHTMEVIRRLTFSMLFCLIFAQHSINASWFTFKHSYGALQHSSAYTKQCWMGEKHHMWEGKKLDFRAKCPFNVMAWQMRVVQFPVFVIANCSICPHLDNLGGFEIFTMPPQAALSVLDEQSDSRFQQSPA